jgi:hypothetical protein
MVLLEAGEPAYFIASLWGATKLRIKVGTSSLDRNLGNGFRLAGLNAIAALVSARQGLAFGIEEIEERISQVADDAYESRIECLAQPYRPGAAVSACARAFIDLLWGSAQLVFERPSCESTCRASPRSEEISKRSGRGLIEKCSRRLF